MSLDNWDDWLSMTGESGSDAPAATDWSGWGAYEDSNNTAGGQSWYSQLSAADPTDAWNSIGGNDPTWINAMTATSNGFGTSASSLFSSVGKSIFGGMNTGNLVSGLLLGGAQAALRSRQNDNEREYAAKLRGEELAEYKRRHTIPAGVAVGKSTGFAAK